MTKPTLHVTILGAVLVCSAAMAQDPAVDQPGQEEAKAPAGLRVWIFPRGDEPMAVVCKTAADEQPRTLASTTGAERTTGETYGEFAPGRIELQLKAGDRIVATAAGSLGDGRQYTAIAMPDGGDWKIKVLADGPAKAESSARPLRICNFAAGRETVLSLQGAGDIKVAGDSLHETEVAPALTGLTIRVLAADGGPPGQSSTEIDFARAPSAYVVIGPDYRGRMRPRVIEGGAPSSVPDMSAGVPEAQQ